MEAPRKTPIRWVGITRFGAGMRVCMHARICLFMYDHMRVICVKTYSDEIQRKYIMLFGLMQHHVTCAQNIYIANVILRSKYIIIHRYIYIFMHDLYMGTRIYIYIQREYTYHISIICICAWVCVRGMCLQYTYFGLHLFVQLRCHL